MTAVLKEHRSYSQLNTLRRCGEQYRLSRIEHVTERPSCAAVAGSAIHLGTEKIDALIHEGVNDHDKLYAAGIHEAATYIADQILRLDTPVSEWRFYGYRPKQDMEWWANIGLTRSINAYIDWRLATPGYVLMDVPGHGPGIEVPFDVMLSEVRIIGKIDRVMVDTATGQPFILDIKSGRKPKTDEQLAPYRLGLQTLGIEVTYGVFVYALKRGIAELTPPIDLSHWTADKLHGVYSQAEKQIQAGLFIPNPGEECTLHCGVAAHCRFAQAAI